MTAAAGPFPETTVAVARRSPGRHRLGRPGQTGKPVTVHQQLTLVGRASPGGPVDDLTLTAGHWADGPGQIVLSSQLGPRWRIGSQLTVTGVPGSPQLTVVGFATSVTGTAPGLGGAVRDRRAADRRGAEGRPDAVPLLRRRDGRRDPADIARGHRRAAARRVLGTQSWLTVKAEATRSFAPWVPFIVAFGRDRAGDVGADRGQRGQRRGGGRHPADRRAQVHRVLARPGGGGLRAPGGGPGRSSAASAGVVAGNLLAVPLLGQTAQVYGVGALAVPVWVDVAVPLAMLALTGLAALRFALRAGRMSAVQAIAAGRAPRPRHGYAAHRLLGRDPWARCCRGR